MKTNQIIQQHGVIQQIDNWYVLDDEFAFELSWLKEQVEQCMDRTFSLPVVFCDSCEANKIVSDLGHEECEHLLYAAGVYWREVNIVFVFSYDDFKTLIETIFHELRHVEQEDIAELKECYVTDKKLPYEERVTERDAFSYAKKMLDFFVAENPQFQHLF